MIHSLSLLSCLPRSSPTLLLLHPLILPSRAPFPILAPFVFYHLRTLLQLGGGRGWGMCLKYNTFSLPTFLASARHLAVISSPSTTHQPRITSHSLLRYNAPSQWETTTCPPATTPGTCSANTLLPNPCANTCSPWKPASAPTPANRAPTNNSGASPPCSTTSTTSASPMP